MLQIMGVFNFLLFLCVFRIFFCNENSLFFLKEKKVLKINFILKSYTYVTAYLCVQYLLGPYRIS